MRKFNLSIITIILIYVITVISSTPKENPVVGDNYAQNSAVNLNSNHWNTKMKIQNTTSIYIGVSWNSKNNKWKTQLKHHGKRYYGGYFDNEEHAAMRVNLLCEEYGIKRKNPEIDIELDVTPKIQNTTSIYTGVSWHSEKKKWQTYLKHNGKQYHGGYFDKEEHAAMKINLLCDEYGITRKNLTIDIKLDVTPKIKTKPSIYTGVSWNSDQNQWKTNLRHDGKHYHGGYFDNEEHAAMKINLLCDKYGIKRKNPEINIDFIQETAASCYKIEKRKRTKQLDYK